MSLAPGEKAKLVTALDHQMSDDLQPLYSIDITVLKSPKKGVKCGAITVFRLNEVDLDFETTLRKRKKRKDHPNLRLIEQAEQLEKEISQQTEVMFQDPILFREPDGQWLAWAVDKALAMYDRFGGCAKISLKCPSLRIKVVRGMKEIAAHRSDPRKLFPVMADIDQLLDRGYSYDPWTKKIRRGRVNAEMSKR
jgi:hypothetical protein